MRVFRMAIENNKTGQRDTYLSIHQGASPAGWRCIGVCGYYDTPKRNKDNTAPLSAQEGDDNE